MKNRECQHEIRRQAPQTCQRSICAGNKGGICRILKSSHFGDKAYPFFKTADQNAKECSAVMNRLITMNCHGLIDKYYGGDDDGC